MTGYGGDGDYEMVCQRTGAGMHSREGFLCGGPSTRIHRKSRSRQEAVWDRRGGVDNGR